MDINKFRPRLKYKRSHLHFDDISLNEVSQHYSTPFYIYSEQSFISNYQLFEKSLASNIKEYQICYALKANSNPSIVKCLAKLGSGADVVSIGELKLAMKCGIAAKKIVFSGVGKTKEEIEQALKLKESICSFNVESLEELQDINQIAKTLNKRARVTFRLNPQVNAKTHKNISTGNRTHKFGILVTDILPALKKSKYFSHTDLVGLSIHIGSQLTCLEATKEAIKRMCKLATDIGELEFLDVGGGLGVDYNPQDTLRPVSMQEYASVVSKTVKKYYSKDIKLVFEPGRVIAAKAGLLITKVIRTKQSEKYNFAILDAGMNDLMRPSLYQAYHHIISCKKPTSKTKSKLYDIVGPICETSDCFAQAREIPEVKEDELMAILDVGAYGFSMANTYNTRSLPKEILITADSKLKSI